MLRRLSGPFDSTLALLVRAAGNCAKHLLPAAPASRPKGGPVVFRHYL